MNYAPLEVRRAAAEYEKQHPNASPHEAYIQGYINHCSSCAQPPLAEVTIVQGGISALPSFSDFWELYDKKRGKPKCEKLWEKLSPTDKIAIIDYIPNYKLAQPDKQYRKDPQTFLRNRSWEDELIYSHNGTAKLTAEEQERAYIAKTVSSIYESQR